MTQKIKGLARRIDWALVLPLLLIAFALLLYNTNADLYVDGKPEPETSILADTAALVAINTEARLEQLDAAFMPNRLISVEEHDHSYEHWFGPHGTPVAEATIAVSMGTTTQTFQLASGNDQYGAWLQILGSSDTPHVAGKASFQIHGILISAVQRATSAHVIQIGFGDSGAAALSADDVLEVPYKPSAASLRSAPIFVQTEEAVAGTKVWARARAIGQASGTLDFYFGLHEGSI